MPILNPTADALALLAPPDSPPWDPPPCAPLMTHDEATSCLWAIRTSTANLRALLFDLHHRQGWRALGYDSFRDCIHAELSDLSESQVYRQLAAGDVEQQIGAPVGSLPEGVLRPLGKVPPIARRPVYEHARQASAKGVPTAEEVEAAADRLLLDCGCDPSPEEDLAQAVERDTANATTLAHQQILDRDQQRLTDRLQRTLHHLRVALKGLKVCGKAQAAEHCQHAIDLAS